MRDTVLTLSMMRRSFDVVSGGPCQQPPTANCIIIDHFLHLNRDWSPRFSTLRDKNGWVRVKTA
jgi:hypothetical protein